MWSGCYICRFTPAVIDITPPAGHWNASFARIYLNNAGLVPGAPMSRKLLALDYNNTEEVKWERLGLN